MCRTFNRISIATFFLFCVGSARAETVAVRYMEGTVHGFLALRTLEGKLLASGDLTQTVKGERLTSRLVFRFRDGSIDDETAVFTQRGSFHLVSDRHIQKGPAFPNPSDVLIVTSTGQVTVRTQEKGRQKVEKHHVDIPPDIVNGIILNVVKNLSADLKETKLSYVATGSKPRVVEITVKPEGQDQFSTAGAPYKANRYRIKVELGALLGTIAGLTGKKPADTNVWVVAGDVPAFVKSEGPLYPGGPVWRIEMTSPAWPGAPRGER